jgi:hypothetical protein
MAICKDCGGNISWKQLPNSAWCPTELDGSNHFDLCSARKSRAIINDTENVYVERYDAQGRLEGGYVSKWEGVSKNGKFGKPPRFKLLTLKASKSIRGKDYVESPQSSDPPWHN